MIAPQSPSLQVFVLIERVSRADVALEHFSSISTIQANHIIVVHGSPHRYSRCENFLSLNGLAEVTQRVMNCGDQVGKLLWSQGVVPNVAADDHSRGMWVGLFGIHDHPLCSVRVNMVNDYVGPKGNRLKVWEPPLRQLPV